MFVHNRSWILRGAAVMLFGASLPACPADDSPNETGGATTADGACPDPPEVPEGVSEQCRQELLGCYADCSSFESDPNDCWNTTLTFPQCDGAMGSSGSDGTSSGEASSDETAAGQSTSETGTTAASTSEATSTGG